MCPKRDMFLELFSGSVCGWGKASFCVKKLPGTYNQKALVHDLVSKRKIHQKVRRSLSKSFKMRQRYARKRAIITFFISKGAWGVHGPKEKTYRSALSTSVKRNRGVASIFVLAVVKQPLKSYSKSYNTREETFVVEDPCFNHKLSATTQVTFTFTDRRAIRFGIGKCWFELSTVSNVCALA